ncbi:MAG: hypothetical protein QMD82_02110 [bacterium]|nr:hypothetical protein [bacterium]
MFTERKEAETWKSRSIYLQLIIAIHFIVHIATYLRISVGIIL